MSSMRACIQESTTICITNGGTERRSPSRRRQEPTSSETGVLTVVIFGRGRFACGPVGSDVARADPLSVHVSDGGFGVL